MYVHVCVFQAGFSMGIVLMVVMALLTLYTAIRVLQSPQSIGQSTKNLQQCKACFNYHIVKKPALMIFNTDQGSMQGF